MLEFESFRELNGEFLLKPNSGKSVMLSGKKGSNGLKFGLRKLKSKNAELDVNQFPFKICSIHHPVPA